MSFKIENNMIPKDVIELSKIFKQEKYEMYIVGGCVRDLIMNKEPHDWDMCTNATPDEMISIFKKHKLHYILTGLQHGTITVHIENDNYEVTTYRVDGDYSDGRHPDNVEFTRSLLEDLSRRDFTMNAIAVDPLTCDMEDPYGGVIAILNKKLIAVGNADDRLREDALRILRAMRFAIKYNMEIDFALKNAMLKEANSLSLKSGKISRERVTDEFRKIFSSGQPVSKIFNEYRDIIGVILPDITCCFDFEQNNKYHRHNVYEHILAVTDACKTTKFEIKMAALLHDIGKPESYVEDENGQGHFYGHPNVSAKICETALKKYFRLSNEEFDRIVELVKFHDMDLVETVKSVRKAMNKHGADYMNDWFILKQADMDDHIYHDSKFIRTVDGFKKIMDDIVVSNLAFTLKDLNINGSVLMSELNLKPSKKIGEILNELLEEVINDDLENEKYKLLERAKSLL